MLGFTNTTSITGAWNSSSGTLTLSGADTLANYRAALRSVIYQNLSENPSEAVRTVSFQVRSGAEESNIVTRDITVTAVDDVPTVSVTTPSSPQSGDVTINYVLMDAESETCSIAVQYSPDGGTTWNLATPGPGGDGTTGLAASPSGQSHTFVWASASDLPSTYNSNVKVRIQPTDPSGTGAAESTQAFTVSNPRMDVELRIVAAPASSDRMTDANFASYASLTTATSIYYAEIWLRDSFAVRGLPAAAWTSPTRRQSSDATAIGHGERVQFAAHRLDRLGQWTGGQLGRRHLQRRGR